MSKLNMLISLQAYEDRNPSNAPNRSFFKWTRNINSIFVNNPTSLEFTLAPGETRQMFNGQRTLTADNTTQFSTTLAPFSTTIYNLQWVGGTAPSFRILRNTFANASTQVTVTANGPVITFTSTGGALFNLIPGGVVVGDQVLIGNVFNAQNQGIWQIIAVTNTSFSIVNASGVAEGPYTLGATYANQVRIFSATGVQVGDTLDITGGFSPVTQGSYVVTQVTDSYLQFSSLSPLPLEGPITTDAIAVYFMAKRMVYMETDQGVSLTMNGVSGTDITPIITTNSCGLPISSAATTSNNPPAMFLRTSIVYSMSVTNTSIDTANVYFASVE